MKRVLLATLIACGPPAAHPVAPTGGGGSGSTTTGAPGADLPADEQPEAPACIPQSDGDVDLAFVGDDLIACVVDRATRSPLGCWDVDPATGEISNHEAMLLPGYGHQSNAGWVAINSDGRKAVVTDGQLEVFDDKGASLAKRPLADAKAPKPSLADVTIANVYFVGDTVYVLGRDAASVSLFELPLGKPAGKPIRNVLAGGVGISRDHLAVHEQALARLTVVDGKTQRITKGRARHEDPCRPDASYGAGHEPADGSACASFLTEHYHPYIDATIIAEGDGYFGVDPHARQVFVLDEHLAQTSRVQLPSCPVR